jgi:hypothetical protein
MFVTERFYDMKRRRRTESKAMQTERSIDIPAKMLPGDHSQLAKLLWDEWPLLFRAIGRSVPASHGPGALKLRLINRSAVGSGVISGDEMFDQQYCAPFASEAAHGTELRPLHGRRPGARHRPCEAQAALPDGREEGSNDSIRMAPRDGSIQTHRLRPVDWNTWIEKARFGRFD